MEIMGHRKESCPISRVKGGSSDDRAVIDVARNLSFLCRVVALTFVLLSSAEPVFGQFTIQPMKLDLQVTSGKLLPQAIDIRNSDTEQSHTIDLRVVDLTQDINGDWQVIEPNSGFDTSKLASIKDSIRLKRNSVTLNPGQRTPVEVQIRVPRGSRGFSCAGILATLGSMTDTEIPVRLRYVVPVILQVMSKSMRHNVESVDVGMEFVAAGERGLGSPATTMMSMEIVNKGKTFPRCRPLARVWTWAGGHWRHVTTTAFQDKTNDIGIIPGARVIVKTDLMKTLPPGKYKIAGELYVDGRRARRIDKEINFAGDPDVERLAVDAALDLDQREVIIESLPGSVRTTSIMVQNASDEILNVRAALSLPRELAGKVISNVRGTDMDCTPWIEIKPEKFTLKGVGSTQIVRITSRMPKDAIYCPNYYTNLDFWSFYPDGQRAGTTPARLAVKNTKFAVEPKADVISMNSYHISGSKYQVVGRFNNVGITHFTPIRCKAAVTELTSNIPRISTILQSDLSLRGLYMLPSENRNFSGIMNLSLLDPGEYRLSVAMQYVEGKWQSKQAAIRITTEGGRRILETIGMQEDLKQVLEVKWSKTSEKAIKNNERG